MDLQRGILARAMDKEMKQRDKNKWWFLPGRKTKKRKHQEKDKMIQGLADKCVEYENEIALLRKQWIEISNKYGNALVKIRRLEELSCEVEACLHRTWFGNKKKQEG